MSTWAAGIDEHDPVWVFAFPPRRPPPLLSSIIIITPASDLSCASIMAVGTSVPVTSTFAFLITTAGFAGYAEVVMTWWLSTKPLGLSEHDFVNRAYLLYPITVLFARFFNPLLITGSPLGAVVAGLVCTGVSHVLLGGAYFFLPMMTQAGEDAVSPSVLSAQRAYTGVVACAFVLAGIGVGTFAPNWWKLLDKQPALGPSATVDAGGGGCWLAVANVFSGGTGAQHNGPKSVALLGIPVGFFIVNFGLKALYLFAAGYPLDGSAHYVVALLQMVAAYAVWRSDALRAPSSNGTAHDRVTPWEVLRAFCRPSNTVFIVLGVGLLLIQLALEATTQYSQIAFEHREVHLGCGDGTSLTSAQSGVLFGLAIAIGNVVGVMGANRLLFVVTSRKLPSTSGTTTAAVPEGAAVNNASMLTYGGAEEREAAEHAAVVGRDAERPPTQERKARQRQLKPVFVTLVAAILLAWISMVGFGAIRGWSGFVWAFTILVANGLYYAGAIHAIEFLNKLPASPPRRHRDGTAADGQTAEAGGGAAAAVAFIATTDQDPEEDPTTTSPTAAVAAAVLRNKLCAKQIFLSLGDIGPICSVVFLGNLVTSLKNAHC